VEIVRRATCECAGIKFGIGCGASTALEANAHAANKGKNIKGRRDAGATKACSRRMAYYFSEREASDFDLGGSKR
jgi:hypothetical protein